MTTLQGNGANGYWRLIYEADKETAEQMATLWSEAMVPEASAVSMFENPARTSWRVDAIYEDEKSVRAALDLLPDEEKLMASVCTLPNQDWVAMSLEGLKPVRAGRYVLYGSHDEGAAGDDEIGILIEAGQAFGTGHHGTTKGCLEAIDEIITATPGLRNALDVGCGTGVLAMAIAKRLSVPIIATDLDPIAVETSKENAACNDCGGIHFAVAAGTDHDAVRESGPYDLVVANILKDPLIMLASDIHAAVASKGRLVLSGILIEQESQVVDAYVAKGFTLDGTRHIDEWTTLVLTKPD